METKQIAETIYKQLGGNRFKAMVGAYNFIFGTEADNVFLDCRFKGSKKANHLQVIYVYGTDTYHMVFKKIGNAPKYKIVEVAKFDDVYCDDLQSIFEDTTGLYTHM